VPSPEQTQRTDMEHQGHNTPERCKRPKSVVLGGGPPAGRPTVTVDTTVLGNVATSAPQGVANGQRVAVLDTGDMNVSTMLDFLGGQPHQSVGDDIVGHGTAVADIVRALNSTAQVESLRVVNAQRSGSYELLCGLTYALWSDRYDAVNVSLSAQQTGGCVTVLGASLNMVMNICQKGANKYQSSWQLRATPPPVRRLGTRQNWQVP
jgi:hypothetical protein